jgi:hypothetical protein
MACPSGGLYGNTTLCIKCKMIPISPNSIEGSCFRLVDGLEKKNAKFAYHFDMGIIQVMVGQKVHIAPLSLLGWYGILGASTWKGAHCFCKMSKNSM